MNKMIEKSIQDIFPEINQSPYKNKMVSFLSSLTTEYQDIFQLPWYSDLVADILQDRGLIEVEFSHARIKVRRKLN